MTMDTTISLDHISKSYKLYLKPADRLREALNPMHKTYHRDFYALRDITFEVYKGETLGIMGKNGSGKSTLLKIITGVLSPSGGTVTLNGKVSALLELGAGFNPEMTGRENIYLNGSMMGYSRTEIDNKLPQILAFADIGEFIDQNVKTYSSGMFARLAFALAINVDPDVLIIDEALAVGDMAFQLKCYKKFKDFKALGKTILIVSHSLDSILRYCDRAVVLNEGQMVAIGSPKEMVDIYKKLLVNYSDHFESDLSYEDKVHHNIGVEIWKDKLEKNTELVEYGDKRAEIIDYGVFDSHDDLTASVLSDDSVTIRMKVRFNEAVSDPVFAFTIKDIKGNEIAGTNTMYEYISTGEFNPKDEVVVSFTQKLKLCSGGYALSLGCVCFISGEFYVFHRLYDVVLLEVHTPKQMAGVFDLNSNVEIAKSFTK